MNKGMIAILLFLCATVFPQSGTTAHGVYARNGILIGLTNLAPLRDCTVRSMEGKARSIDIENGIVTFDLKSDTERRTFRFPLLNLAATERRALRRNFLKKGNTLRATAYECGDTTEPLETISLDRSY